MTSDDDPRQRLWGMIKPVKVAMLTSEDGERLRSRPMVASQRDFDGALWFFTRADSHKVEETRDHDRVCVSYAEPERQVYVSLSGHARLVRDDVAIKQHWSEAMRTWFPGGVGDPNIALLRVDIDAAEYWDAPSSTMVYLYGYAKAVLTGTPPNPGRNEKLTLT